MAGASAPVFSQESLLAPHQQARQRSLEQRTGSRQHLLDAGARAQWHLHVSKPVAEP